ncbi:hypothetical protein Taro_020606, partial [Colocasia esculenta]|nr:hypothetical protein [Colocasia esculenta]
GKFIDGCAALPDMDTVTENLVTELCDANGVIQNRELSFKDSCSLPTSGLMQLDTEPDMFGNDHGDEEGGSFLNCDWGNIADFDDLDRIFRNNSSIFGHEIIGNVDELLSPSTDSINAMAVRFCLAVWLRVAFSQIDLMWKARLGGCVPTADLLSFHWKHPKNQGVDPSIRGEVWEFLLGCYALGSTSEYRKQLRIARSCIRKSNSKVVCCHFSSDGKLLASGGHEKKAIIWNTDTLQTQSSPEEHSLLITDIRFRPNSTQLATSSFDRTVRLWNATQNCHANGATPLGAYVKSGHMFSILPHHSRYNHYKFLKKEINWVMH